jgi:hypothetical protein
MLVGESAGTLVAFSSSDDGSSSGSKRPKLTVTYACECGVGGSSGSAVLQPGSGGEDTFGWDGAHQDTNFGVSSILQLNNASAERFSLLRFDFSGLPPGALVSSASLELYLEGGSALAGGVLDVHRATQPWIEGTQDDQTTTGGASYNVYSLGNPWTSSGGDYDSPPMDSITIPKLTSGFYSWDVTPAVADWVAGSATNDGFFVRASGGNVDKISFTSSDSASTAQHPRLTIAYTCPCGVDCGGGGTGYSSGLILSTDSDATLGGLAFTDIDLAEYDAATDSATLFFEGALTKLDKDIDAVHVLDSGNIVLSTKDAATLGGLSFGDGDLVEYDPSTDTATLFFDGGLFAGAEDVISVHVMDNGHLVLSTDSPAVLGGLSFDDIDLVEYDPVADKATLFFEGALTTLDQDINAVHVLDSGNIVLSTKSPAMLGGIKFLESSLVEYDPSTDSATLYFDGMLFAGSENVISAFVGTGAQDSGPDLLMVVADPLDLTAQEEAKQALIEGWGYSVSLIDDEDTQSAFKEALDATDVAYVSGDVDPGLLGTKLTSTPRGVVNEHYELHDELGFAQQKDTKGFDKIMVVDVTHSITEGFSTGWLTVTTSEQPLEAMDGGVAPGLQTLATVWITGANYQDGLAVLDPGAALYGGGSAAGRRAQLPWGTTGFDIGALNANGLLIMERAIRWAEGAGGGGAWALRLRRDVPDVVGHKRQYLAGKGPRGLGSAGGCRRRGGGPEREDQQRTLGWRALGRLEPRPAVPTPRGRGRRCGRGGPPCPGRCQRADRTLRREEGRDQLHAARLLDGCDLRGALRPLLGWRKRQLARARFRKPRRGRESGRRGRHGEHEHFPGTRRRRAPVRRELSEADQHPRSRVGWHRCRHDAGQCGRLIDRRGLRRIRFGHRLLRDRVLEYAARHLCRDRRRAWPSLCRFDLARREPRSVWRPRRFGCPDPDVQRRGHG